MANVKQRPYGGVYEGMEFPDYVYEHYPLAMTKAGTKGQLIVENEEEEAKAVKDGYVAPKVGPPARVTQAEVEDLQGEVGELSDENAKLKKELADAKAALAAKAEGKPAPASSK